MRAYLYPIKMAVLIFPLLALVISLPIFAYEYRKRGAFSRWRAFIMYTFIFYLLTAYFLIILPLPARSVVAQLTTPRYNLHPLLFIQEFLQTNTLNIFNIHTYRHGLLEPALIQPLFNIFLTVPFGIYLRYFGRSWKQVLLTSFLLSLFFELTQLSGLYGIYPRPYRLFDVDDLLMNTTGGIVGFWMAPIIIQLFPSRSKIETQEIKLGRRVTYTRRFVALALDWLAFLVLFAITSVLFAALHFQNNLMLNILPIVIFIICFVLIPTLHHGETLGKSVVNIQIVKLDGEKAGFWRLFWRAFWQYLVPGFIFASLFVMLNSLLHTGYVTNKADLDRVTLIEITGVALVALLGLHLLINMIRHNPRLYYDTIAKTREESSFPTPKKSTRSKQ